MKPKHQFIVSGILCFLMFLATVYLAKNKSLVWFGAATFFLILSAVCLCISYTNTFKDDD